jgi:GDP-D-mannose dehydratase
MKLVIGNSSQLAHYFPENYTKISSRKIDFNYLKNNSWEAAYITFAEQRIYDANIDYITPNYTYTLQIIDALLKSCNKIVCYTSCELWNELSGEISLNTPAKFYPINNEYSISKLLLWNKIIKLRKSNSLYNKVIFMHPFYFNSIYRSKYFLFGKIFDSIINKKKIQVGNLNFHRDMVHTKFVVEKSIELNNDAMIGAGKLFNVREFIKDLYQLNRMDFESFVEEGASAHIGKSKSIMAKVDWDYTYQNLLSDTQDDILNSKEYHGYNR